MTAKIALVGNYNPWVTAHRAIPPALKLAAGPAGIAFEWLPTEEIRQTADIDGFDGVWVVPNSPYRSTEGALLAIRTARESGTPFLGTCGGFQHAIVEYARNVLGWHDADHAELSPDSPRLVVTPLACPLVEVTGTLRFTHGSRIASAYGADSAEEGFHCRFGVSPEFVRAIAGSRLEVTATDEAGDARAIELDGHPHFVATLFQPERAALDGRVPPLVREFVRAVQARVTARVAPLPAIRPATSANLEAR